MNATLYSVGCACVFVGAWSYLVTASRPRFFYFKLNGCYRKKKADIMHNKLFNLKN